MASGRAETSATRDSQCAARDTLPGKGRERVLKPVTRVGEATGATSEEIQHTEPGGAQGAPGTRGPGTRACTDTLPDIRAVPWPTSGSVSLHYGSRGNLGRPRPYSVGSYFLFKNFLLTRWTQKCFPMLLSPPRLVVSLS